MQDEAVEMMNMSSLRVGCQLFLGGETLLNKKMNELDYGTLIMINFGTQRAIDFASVF